jgi:hypothetical protein
MCVTCCEASGGKKPPETDGFLPFAGPFGHALCIWQESSAIPAVSGDPIPIAADPMAAAKTGQLGGIPAAP